MNDTLLIELRSEELPPKSLAKLGQSFFDSLQKALLEAGFIEADAAGRWFATPRRLAVQFAGCKATPPDRVIEKKGPAVAAGVGADGTATKALEGFMRGAGVRFEQLEKVQDGKADYFVARLHKSGEALDVQLPAMVDAALKKLPVAKLMRWGTREVQFVRPVHGLLMLHGDRVVPGTVLGLSSSRQTLGHRFMCAEPIVIAHADQYAQILAEKGRVIACFATRRDMIRAELDAAAARRQLAWLHDDALLDEVTALVEHPSVYEAEFEAEFLAVPQECLILTMKANQKYFPLMDGGKLTHRFLVVSNMDVADPVHIVSGNARVVRPRLADAKFFFETDKKTPLASRVALLDRVVYHNKLGSQGERVQRLVRLAGQIARHLQADVTAAERAARLSKADLVTGMVGEFPELQGIMGRYYALADDESPVVADAIEAAYHPRFNGDSLPQGHVACAVALAERLDALTGFFGIGQIPTGDKDPFALRRATLGILRILLETPLPLDLSVLIDDATDGFAHGMLTEGFKPALQDFIRERLRHFLRDAGHEQNAVEAVLAVIDHRIDHVPARLAAVKAFAALPEAAALAAANKRIVNILKKTDNSTATVDVLRLHEPAEKALFAAVNAATPGIEAQFANADYAAALKSLAALRDAVDAFFDGVMVMADEPLIRANRIALLTRLARLMNQVADISLL